jgi:limonene-1,2-epoxide hydrolase
MSALIPLSWTSTPLGAVTGEAVTRAVIVDGISRGATRAVLQASDAGRPLYERLGFRDAGDDIVYRRGPEGVTT